MTDFLIPTALELKLVEQDLLPRLMANRPIFDWFPIIESDDSILAWEQQDNYVGLQQLRGLNGSPPRVQRTGAKRYMTEPGVYGEFSLIDEAELTRRRAYGSLTQLVDTTELVGIEQQRLLQRRLDRQELICWTLLTTGSFTVLAYTGAPAHADTYNFQSFTAAVSWGTYTTATPLADLRAIQTLSRGHSVSFDGNAVAVMNRKTSNKVFSNTNSADIYGRRTQGLGTYNSQTQVNTLLTEDDIPNIQVYDQGYLDDTGTFVPYIPDNKAIVIGKRLNDAPLGNFVMTRNATNPGLAPGAYTEVKDNNLPRSIEVHDGFNGGVTLSYPSSVVVMSV